MGDASDGGPVDLERSEGPVFEAISEEALIDSTGHVEFLGYRQMTLALLNVAAQLRSEFPEDSLSELRESVEGKGVLTPLMVCLMTEVQARSYVEFTNETWGREIEFDDTFVPVDPDAEDKEYAVLIDGERRLRAMSGLDSYTSAQDPKQFRIELYRLADEEGFSFLLETQAEKNFHDRVDPLNNIIGVMALYKLAGHDSMAAFLRDNRSVGRTLGYKAKKYYELPETVRAKTEAGEINLPMALEIGSYMRRLRQRLIDTAKHEYIAAVALVNALVDEQIDVSEIRVPKEVSSAYKLKATGLSESEATIKANLVIDRRKHPAFVKKNRDMWIDEYGYNISDLFTSNSQAVEDTDEIDRMNLTRSMQRMLNSDSRDTESRSKMYSSLMRDVANHPWVLLEIADQLSRKFRAEYEAVRLLVETLEKLGDDGNASTKRASRAGRLLVDAMVSVKDIYVVETGIKNPDGDAAYLAAKISDQEMLI